MSGGGGWRNLGFDMAKYRHVPEVRMPPPLPAGWDEPPWPPPGAHVRRTAADGGRPLTAPEVYVLYDAWTDGAPPSATTAIKLAIVELVRARVLLFARRPRPRALGVPLPPQRWLLEGDRRLEAGAPLVLRDVDAAVRGELVATDVADALGMPQPARGVRVSKLAAPVRRMGPDGPGARKPKLDEWLEQRVAQPLVDRGFITWGTEPRAGLLRRLAGPARVLDPTPSGQVERAFARVAWELPPEEFAALRAADPRGAARLVAAVGSALLLQPALYGDLAELGRALEVIAPRSDGSSGDGGSSSTEADSGDAMSDLEGVGDLSGLDGLSDLGDLGDLSDLSDTWDAVDSGVGSDGGGADGDGGDGGGGD